MNLKKQTIEVLRNFNGINQGILFREGNTIRTMSVMRTIFASAVVEDVFPKEFAIYDLGEFLSTISLFENPDIQFKDEYFIVAEGTSKVKYFYSNPNVVVSAPEKQVAMPTPDITFNLAKSQIDQLLKASAVMKLKDFAVTDGGVKVFNRNSVGNQYTIDLEIETRENISTEELKDISRKLGLLRVFYSFKEQEIIKKYIKNLGEKKMNNEEKDNETKLNESIQNKKVEIIHNEINIVINDRKILRFFLLTKFIWFQV